MSKIVKREEVRLLIQARPEEEGEKVTVDLKVLFGFDGSSLGMGFFSEKEAVLFTASLETEEEAFEACRTAALRVLVAGLR